MKFQVWAFTQILFVAELGSWHLKTHREVSGRAIHETPTQRQQGRRTAAWLLTGTGCLILILYICTVTLQGRCHYLSS